MPKIERSARSAKAISLSTTTERKAKDAVRGMKRVTVHAPPASDTGKKPKGYETWEVEAEGIQAVEVNVEIPVRTHNLKDPAAREEKVKALVLEAAIPLIHSALLDHAG